MGGLSTEENLRFKIDLASLIVGRKFTVFALFTLYLRAISKCKPPWEGGGGYIWRGYLTEGFCVLSLGGLFSEYYGIYTTGLVISHSGDSYHDIIIIIN